MNVIAEDFLSGTVMSFVPIYVLTKYFFENKIKNEDFDFKNTVMYLPIKMGLINVSLFILMKNIFPEHASNPVIFAVLMSISLGMITKTFNEVPEKIIQMENSNVYHLYTVIVFTVLYFIALRFKKTII